MNKRLDGVFILLVIVIGTAMIIGAPINSMAVTSIYKRDLIRNRIKGLDPTGQPIPYDTNVKDIYFDGYPQLVKKEASKPIYQVKMDYDIMVPMRDGVRLAADIYRPDVDGKKFPVILSYGNCGKDLQRTIRWLPRQEYNPDTPFWDGYLEAGNINYVVTRGYVHVIPDPRNKGKSEGTKSVLVRYAPEDIYDIIEWIVRQPWCDGNVGMMGACNYASQQLYASFEPHPNLKAVTPFEILGFMINNINFHGIYDCVNFSIQTGRHGNDSHIRENVRSAPRMLSLPKDELDRRLEEALNHPDIKYNSKWYCLLSYPNTIPRFFDALLSSFHPTPQKPFPLDKLKIPSYMSTPWSVGMYIWDTFDVWEKHGSAKKKLMLCPPAFPDRPFVQYTDDTVRWLDYWLKGIDTGIMDEPPIKMFVMGVNKWRFEDEWPLARTEWTKYYLHPKGSLTKAPPLPGGPPDTFVQPAPYKDSTVYCLRYSTGPLHEDLEITGPMALYLEASIDIDDTNWMVDFVDVDPVGNRMLLGNGYLKAAHRALDKSRSRPYQPIHPRQDPIPVSPGEIIEYAICMMPTSNVFLKGHSMELIIRNQDDLLSKQGIWGVYKLPFMRDVTHNIYFGKSHLLLPVIPAK